jgi:Fe-S-cluster containining protein
MAQRPNPAHPVPQQWLAGRHGYATPSATMSHPCLRCGACCAFFRVSFHWRESADAKPDGVPLAQCSDLNSTLRVMRGTERAPTRCHALLGTLGEGVRCSIYEQRPSPCRDFTASYEHGVHQSDCDRARAAHGLPALTPADWAEQPPQTPPQRGPRRAA